MDTDGDAEWEEVMGLLSETPELDLAFNDDGSVTVRWEKQEGDESPEPLDEWETNEEAAPF